MSIMDGIWLPYGDSDHWGNISTAVKEAIHQANREDFVVLLVFNETPVLVPPGSEEEEISQKWWNARRK